MLSLYNIFIVADKSAMNRKWLTKKASHFFVHSDNLYSLSLPEILYMLS
jgi:hypothetical protein